jgi:CubicO group peptidase (beta-lactamase class C family)
MRQLFAFSFCLFTSFATIAQPAFITDSLDAYIQREMLRWQIPGLAIAVVKDGKVVVSKGYGERVSGQPEKVNEFTLFQIASNSKAFTGTAIALLDYEKRLKLDEKVTTYMPYFKLHNPAYTDMCTVRDLLCHRIGLQTFQGDFLNWGSTLTRKQIIEKLALTPEKYPFRYTYGYCNAAYITAGEIIPVVTDTSWDDFLTHRFFKPLGMVHTNTRYVDMLNDTNACKPHTVVKEKIQVIPLANIDNMGPSASIQSCVADMSKWVLLQLNNGKHNGIQLIAPEVIRETRKSAMVVNDSWGGLFKTRHFITYGLGWRSYDYEGRRVFEHSGGANGFVTKTELIPEENLGVVVYTNTDANSLYDALCKQVIEAYMNMPYRNLSVAYYNNGAASRKAEQEKLTRWDSLAAHKPKLPMKADAYTGTFSNNFYGKVWVKNEKGTLRLYFENHPQNVGTIKYMGNDEFVCYYSDLTCGIEPLKFTVSNGTITGITVKVNDFIDYLSYDFEKE